MSKELVQELLKKTDSPTFYALENAFHKQLSKEIFYDCSFTEPESLDNVSVLIGDHHGYKLVSMEEIMKKVYGVIEKAHEEDIKNLEKKIKDMEDEDLNNSISGIDIDENDDEMEDRAAEKRALKNEKNRVAKKIGDTAGTIIGNILKKQQVVFQNEEGEVGLLAYRSNKLTSLTAEEVKTTMKNPEDIGIFNKFILAVKEFFHIKKSEEELKFMTQQNVHELEKAKSKFLGIKEPEKEAKQPVEKQSVEKSSEKAEPRKDEPQKHVPKKAQGKTM